MKERPKRILVAGLGNIFFGDDAFGVHAVRRFLEQPKPAGVRVIDVGICGMTLIDALLEGYDLIILLDAVTRGNKPGTLYLIEPTVSEDGAALAARVPLDAHDLDPAKVLQHAVAMGARLGKLRLIGCEPCAEGPMGFSEGLSENVREAVDRAVALATQLIDQELNRNATPAAAMAV